MDDASPARIELAVQALARMSPDLAGLLARGLEVLQAGEQPGSVYLLAHAGREISSAVVSLLSDTPVALTPEEEEELKRKEQSFRRHIASALNLSIDHPLVAEWFELHDVFVSNAHFPRADEPRDFEVVATAFREFLEYLFARVAPYFEALRELEDFLNQPVPAPEDLQRVRQLLVRPSLRRFFFHHLEHPGWLPPLVASGLIGRPLSPGENEPSIRWSVYAWPEGTYLVRMAKAGADRDALFQAIDQIPPTTRNPMAWGIAAEVAIHLPAPHAKKLVNRLKSALDGPIPFLFPERLCALAIRFANAGEKGVAFHLAEKLLEVQSRVPPHEVPADTAWVRQDATLRYFAAYEMDELFESLIPALAEVNPFITLKILIRVAAAAAYAAGSDAGGTGDGSRYWRTSPRRGRPVDSLKDALTHAILTLSVETARKSPNDAARVLEMLEAKELGVLRRVRLLVLAEVGPVQPARLDQVVVDEALFDGYEYQEEYETLLQRQFRNASEPARQTHIRLIREEIPRAQVVDYLQFLGNAEPTEQDIREVGAGRTVRLIERLGEPVPEELRALLDEQRAYLAVLEARRAERHPPERGAVDLEPLERATPQELVVLLDDWTAAPRDSRVPEPQVASLLRRRVTEDPQGHEIIGRLRWTDLPLIWLREVLHGWVDALGRGMDLPWKAVLDAAEWLVVAQTSDFTLADNRATELLRESKTAALKLIANGAQANRLAIDLTSQAWRVLGAAQVSFDEVEDDPKISAYPRGFAGAAIAGQAVRAAVELALVSIRRRAEGCLDAPAPEAALPILGAALGSAGDAATAARIMTGAYLPWLILVDAEWTVSRAASLFPAGFAPGSEDPAWQAYLHSGFYPGVFELLRPTYLAAAQELAGASLPESEIRDSPTQQLCSHVAWAYLRGAISAGETDRLLETVFADTPVSALGHVYGEIYREVTDAGEKVAAGVPERLVSLWEWRLDELESRTGLPRSSEEARELAWLFQVAHLPDARALQLLRRTLAISGGRAAFPPWERLAAVAAADPPTALDVAQRLISVELASDRPHLDREEVTMVLRVGMADRRTREATTRLVHDLGDASFDEFRVLLLAPDE